MRLKNQKAPKINKNHINEIKRETECPAHPVFCFKSITLNKNYNFEYFKKNNSERNKAAFFLIDKLQELSEKSWEELLSLPKEIGYETLPISRMNYNFNLGKDEKIISIRFGNGDAYRILGVKRDKCPIFDVLGFDFDFSSYNHG